MQPFIALLQIENSIVGAVSGAAVVRPEVGGTARRRAK